MRIITSLNAMQRLARQWKLERTRIGFVPTMGCLHQGHVSLIRRARQIVTARGRVVVSIYVNPAQFGPQEDFSRYPRDLAGDQRLCRDAGVDVVFAPRDQAMYPSMADGAFSTYVNEESLSHDMEGASRPTHFRGVTTIVAKLFNLVRPDVAIFGAKDFQQAAVVRRMVRDLNFPVRIVVAPTGREADGLAMSSRNRYLSSDERAQAKILRQAILLARKTARRTGPGVPVTRLKMELGKLIRSQPAARLDYVEVFDPKTLQRAESAKRGLRLALAVFIGKTRLIDNDSL